MTREQMQNTIISIYGMEHPITIWFFELCEEYEDNRWNNQCLQSIVDAHWNAQSMH